jgi:hypothetical protein
MECACLCGSQDKIFHKTHVYGARPFYIRDKLAVPETGTFFLFQRISVRSNLLLKSLAYSTSNKGMYSLYQVFKAELSKKEMQVFCFCAALTGKSITTQTLRSLPN